MNFIEEYKKGQNSVNKGLFMGEGLININNTINGIQKSRIYGIAGSPKSGKSTFTDYAFVIQPYLHSLKENLLVEWIYFSFEIDRISKEFDFASFFLNHDFNIYKIKLKENVRKKNKEFIEMSADYLRGRILDDSGKTIKTDNYVFECLKKVYEKRIIPLFGEYDKYGKQIKKGLIDFIENRNNPTGIKKFLMDYANKNGKFIKNGNEFNKRITGYKANNPNKHIIIITDHLRKLLPEKNFQMKQNVDKYIQYSVELKNLCGFTFAHILHLNRNLTDIQRQKQFGDNLFPNSDDLKDTGNLAEDSDYIFTIFDPNDQRYGLERHFGKQIKDNQGNEIYPNLKTIHLVESRHCTYPQHFSVEMLGCVKNFKTIKL